MKNHQEIVYESLFGEEMIEVLKTGSYSQIFFLVDENTNRYCFKLIEPKLKELQLNYHLMVISAGEESKSLEQCSSLWKQLSLSNAARDAVLVNLGGGVVCDLGGFVASVYKRGIDFIHYPTSLLAMVDAALGGKCGIDFMNFKNQIGSFRFPEKTIINRRFLDTLPKEEVLSAYAEMIKHALIADQTYWEELKELDLEETADWDALIKQSVAIKLYLVEKDPLEKGDRKKLNFGHTIAHALEKIAMQKGKPIAHGIAVAAGILVESYLSSKYYRLEESSFKEIEALVVKYFPKVTFRKEDIAELLSAIGQDKKKEKNANRFTLLDDLGKASINHNLESKAMEEGFNYYLKLY